MGILSDRQLVIVKKNWPHFGKNSSINIIFDLLVYVLKEYGKNKT